MTREILFRGKRPDNGQWAYGDIHQNKQECKVYMAGDSSETLGGISHLLWDVDPETVGQFTGIFDQKGGQVFEGDIFFEEIETEEGDIRMYCVVVWLTTKGGFATLNKGEYNEWLGIGDECLDPSEYYEIDQKGIQKMQYAGNIHDNPNLLV